MTLYDALLALYETYGYYREGVKAITLKGLEGVERIARIMQTFRAHTPESFCGQKVVEARDYKNRIFRDMISGKESESPLPPSDMLYYTLEDGTWICIRPSGTEPKLKFYIGVKARTLKAAEDTIAKLEEEIDAQVEKI